MVMTHRSRFAFAVLAMSVTAAASGCPSDLPTVLSLTIVPGEIRGVEHVLHVSVQDDGCLRVRRPAHWHRPGKFGGVLAAPSLRAAQAMSRMHLLAGFDGENVAAELTALEDARGQAYAVLGADRYVLRWTDDSGRGHEAAFSGVHQYAERYPDRVDLAAFASLVSMLQAEAERDDLVDLAATP
jgi:hypothetical protein